MTKGGAVYRSARFCIRMRKLHTQQCSQTHTNCKLVRLVSASPTGPQNELSWSESTNSERSFEIEAGSSPENLLLLRSSPTSDGPSALRSGTGPVSSFSANEMYLTGGRPVMDRWGGGRRCACPAMSQPNHNNDGEGVLGGTFGASNRHSRVRSSLAVVALQLGVWAMGVSERGREPARE